MEWLFVMFFLSCELGLGTSWDEESEVWAFLFQNLLKWDERNIDQPKFTVNRSILFINGHGARPLSNPYF